MSRHSLHLLMEITSCCFQATMFIVSQLIYFQQTWVNDFIIKVQQTHSLRWWPHVYKAHTSWQLLSILTQSQSGTVSWAANRFSTTPTTTWSQWTARDHTWLLWTRPITWPLILTSPTPMLRLSLPWQAGSLVSLLELWFFSSLPSSFALSVVVAGEETRVHSWHLTTAWARSLSSLRQALNSTLSTMETTTVSSTPN